MSTEAQPPATGKHMSIGDPEMINAVNTLSERVETLTRELTVSKQQARRTRVLSIAVIAMIVGGMIIGWDYARRISNNVEANSATQVQSCENANAVRKSNILLWEQVLSLSTADGTETPAEVAALVALQDWITVLYRNRDCANLDKVYENPPPPDFDKIMGANRE